MSSKNRKWKDQVQRRERQAKMDVVSKAVVNSTVPPDSSWWLNAPRERFTKKAEAEVRPRLR